jgi:hypothetical protein
MCRAGGCGRPDHPEPRRPRACAERAGHAGSSAPGSPGPPWAAGLRLRPGAGQRRPGHPGQPVGIVLPEPIGAGITSLFLGVCESSSGLSSRANSLPGMRSLFWGYAQGLLAFVTHHRPRRGPSGADFVRPAARPFGGSPSTRQGTTEPPSPSPHLSPSAPPHTIETRGQPRGRVNPRNARRPPRHQRVAAPASPTFEPNGAVGVRFHVRAGGCSDPARARRAGCFGCVVVARATVTDGSNGAPRDTTYGPATGSQPHPASVALARARGLRKGAALRRQTSTPAGTRPRVTSSPDVGTSLAVGRGAFVRPPISESAGTLHLGSHDTHVCVIDGGDGVSEYQLANLDFTLDGELAIPRDLDEAVREVARNEDAKRRAGNAHAWNGSYAHICSFEATRTPDAEDLVLRLRIQKAKYYHFMATSLVIYEQFQELGDRALDTPLRRQLVGELSGVVHPPAHAGHVSDTDPPAHVGDQRRLCVRGRKLEVDPGCTRSERLDRLRNPPRQVAVGRQPCGARKRGSISPAAVAVPDRLARSRGLPHTVMMTKADLIEALARSDE